MSTQSSLWSIASRCLGCIFIALATSNCLDPGGTILAVEVPSQGNDPSDRESLMRRWVDDLGGPTFSERERATRMLLQEGMAALPWLQAATTDPDREVRVRAATIVADLLRRDRPRRIAEFLSKAVSQGSTALPGWARLEWIAGDSPASRKFLADILRIEWDLIQQSQDKNGCHSLLQQRCLELHEQLRTGGHEDMQWKIAAVMLASLGAAPQQPADAATVTRVYALLRAQTWNRGQDATDLWRHDVFQRLVGRYLIHTTHPATAQMAMQIAVQRHLPDLGELCRTQLEHPGMPVAVDQWSLLLLGKIGSEQYLPVVESFLEDTQICHRRMNGQTADAKAFECRIQDAALLAKWQIHGRDVAELGFSALAPHPFFGFLPQSVGFHTAEERAAAFLKLQGLDTQAGP